MGIVTQVSGTGAIMTGKLIPFGYATKDAEERLAELMQDENMMLMDIRLKPVSRWRPVWNRDALSAAWKRRYFWVGFKLGNKNYNKDRKSTRLNSSHQII